jgi:multiple sugar transport system permease protein/putative chitobiose transport system permease protein
MGGTLTKRAAYLVGGVLILIVFLAPFLWLLASSFKDQTAIFRDVDHLSIWTFLPRSATLENFHEVLFNRGLGRAMLNSTIVAVAQVVGTVAVCSLAAYPLTRMRIRGRDALFVVLIVTMLVPTEALVVPLYGIVSKIGLSNSLWAIFLPWVASPFGLFLMRQAFLEVPHELDEAATLDGAGHIRILFSILLPNVKASLATLSLITFMFAWNAFFWPLVAIQSSSKQVVQVALAQLVVPGELPNWGIILAGAVIATVPVLTLFALLQRFFVAGLTSSAVKG